MSAFATGLVLLSAVLHALWNQIAHARRLEPMRVLRVPLLIGLIGFIPAVVAELQAPALNGRVLWLLPLAGLFQTVYYLGLVRAYSASDFSVAYPLIRGLPVLMLAAFDLLRGRTFSALSFSGLFLTSFGCVLPQLESLAGSAPARPSSRALAWALFSAAGIAGYSIVDKLALESMPAGASVSARFTVWESLASVPFLWIVTLRERGGEARSPLRSAFDRWSLLTAVFTFASYWLLLWAYQLTDHVSYANALRQLSIVLGTLSAHWIFREAGARVRIVAAVVIAAGAALVVLGT